MTTPTLSRRRVTAEKAESSKLRRETVGARIQKLRYQRGITQDQLSVPTGRGRSAVAQWERDDCEPPLEVIVELAKLLECTPQFLAFGITGEPEVVAPDAETLGYALVPERTYGDGPEDVKDESTWGIPISWLKSEGQVGNTDGLIIFKCEFDVAGYQFGDRLLVDTKATRVSPPGAFLHWDGISAVISNITPVHAAGKPVARVSGLGETYELPVSDLHVLGRVRAIWRKP